MRKRLLVGIATLGVLGLVMANPVFAVDLGVGTLNDAAGDSGAGFGTNISAAQLVGNLIDILLGLLGIIFLVLVIYAGMLWMTSAGDAKRVEKAKGILSTAVVGLVITMSAYAISWFVIEQLVNATGTGRGPVAAPGADTGTCFDGDGNPTACGGSGSGGSEEESVWGPLP